MASRKEQKEQARARRLAEEQARTERARRGRRLRMMGGVVLVAVALIAVLIAVSSGGASSPSGLAKGKSATATVAGVEQLLNGIPQSGTRLGSPTAPVTMTYYGDLECPICRDFELTGGFSQLVSTDVKQGKVQIVYKAFKTATTDLTVFQTQQVAALAAGQQGRFWDFSGLFYHEQGQEGTGYVTEPYLQGLAKQVPGLSLVKWESDRNSQALATQVQSEYQTGRSIGVGGTPTLVFKGPKGQTAIASAASYSQLQQAIKQVT